MAGSLAIMMLYHSTNAASYLGKENPHTEYVGKASSGMEIPQEIRSAESKNRYLSSKVTH